MISYQLLSIAQINNNIFSMNKNIFYLQNVVFYAQPKIVLGDFLTDQMFNHGGMLPAPIAHSRVFPAGGKTTWNVLR